MKKVKTLAALLGFLPLSFAVAATSAHMTANSQANSKATLSSNFSNMTDQTSYALGATLGQNMRKQGISLSSGAFIHGFDDGFSGHKPLLNDAEIKASMMAFQKQMMAKAMKKEQVTANGNLNEGEKFLDNNKTKTGIVSLPDGLQYQVIHAGMGASPGKNDTVTVDYKASTINGKVFDSSYKRGKPAVFKVSNMIRGFQEALLLMKTGGIWEVYIPSQLAYGSRGVPGVIGPNETLIFKIHLISVKKNNK